MTSLDDFLNKKKRVQGESVEMTLACQRCYEQVYEAEFFRVEKILKWKCSQDHISYIENWNLWI